MARTSMAHSMPSTLPPDATRLQFSRVHLRSQLWRRAILSFVSSKPESAALETVGDACSISVETRYMIKERQRTRWGESYSILCEKSRIIMQNTKVTTVSLSQAFMIIVKLFWKEAVHSVCHGVLHVGKFHTANYSEGRAFLMKVGIIKLHLTRYWKWKDYSIRYQAAGDEGPALILIHGFGANCDHWRKNIPVLANRHRVYAIDLLGYGYSDKPNPMAGPPNSIYNFENWASQIIAFCSEIVNDKVFLICNSVGGVVGLQTALSDSNLVRGLVLLNISLRMLHIKKQQWYIRPFVRAFQNILRNTELGKLFFKSVATTESVKRILCQCYYDDSAVTDELVEKILLPGLEPGAIDVFLDFICYSGGPLPEEMLPNIKCPVLIGWGERDPWEPIELGKAYAGYNCVEEFVVLPNVGHCPQDEAPDLINPLVESFVSRHVMS